MIFPLTLEQFALADLHQVLSELSTTEKISLLAGPNWWNTTPIPRVGVPSIKSSDGPNGKSAFLVAAGLGGAGDGALITPATAIPCETALAATFDTELIQKVGGLLARECRAKGASLLLAPTCNIQRNPLNGRAFESFSEDPFLSGLMAAAYINGLQEGGVGAVIKHFVCNDMEDQRLSVNAVVGDRALREIYLTPFLIAERLAKPWGVMTAYSRLNGVHCSENASLLEGILRKEWGFDGIVISDWQGTYSCDTAMNAGLDLEMPGPTRWRGGLVSHLLKAGKITIQAIDARAYAVLQVAQKACIADIELVRANTAKEGINDSPEDRLLNRRTAAESIVLLKNNLGVLPLSKKGIKTLAILGPNAKTRTVSGGGSAYLTSSYVVTPFEGLEAAVRGEGVEVKYSTGCYGHRYLPMLDGWIKTDSGEPGWTATFHNDSWDTPPVDTHVLLSTRMRINDEKPKGVGRYFYAKLEGFVVAQETGPFELGISLVGRAQLFIDGKLAIDNGINSKQTPGDSFYGMGTIEEVGEVNFVAGTAYRITVKYTNTPSPHEGGGLKQPPLMMAALRVGGAPKLDVEKAIKDAVDCARESDAAVLVIGLNMDWETEAADRAGLDLPGKTDELVRRVLAANPRTVIVNQSGSAVSMPWIDQAPTVVQAWFAGNECGNAIADVLFGDVNPSARLPLTFPRRIEDCTAHLNWAAESGKVTYGEGIFVGYRGYDLNKSIPLFHFGHGLSYSTFGWMALKATLDPSPKSAANISGSASITVTNTSAVPGRDIVQLYISQVELSHRHPIKELKAFAKTPLLQPGESAEVTISLDKISFSFWNDLESTWMAQKGDFEILVSRSASAEDLVLRATVTLDRTLNYDHEVISLRLSPLMQQYQKKLEVELLKWKKQVIKVEKERVEKEIELQRVKDKVSRLENDIFQLKKCTSMSTPLSWPSRKDCDQVASGLPFSGAISVPSSPLTGSFPGDKTILNHVANLCEDPSGAIVDLLTLKAERPMMSGSIQSSLQPKLSRIKKRGHSRVGSQATCDVIDLTLDSSSSDSEPPAKIKRSKKSALKSDTPSSARKPPVPAHLPPTSSKALKASEVQSAERTTTGKDPAKQLHERRDSMMRDWERQRGDGKREGTKKGSGLFKVVMDARGRVLEGEDDGQSFARFKKVKAAFDAGRRGGQDPMSQIMGFSNLRIKKSE
ncbi:beta-glucosidase, partial [Phenoliferia sp. Uapishka_3]